MSRKKHPRVTGKAPLKEAILVVSSWILRAVMPEPDWRACTLEKTDFSVKGKLIVPIDFIKYYIRTKLGHECEDDDALVGYIGQEIDLSDYNFAVISETDDGRYVVLQCEDSLTMMRVDVNELIIHVEE